MPLTGMSTDDYAYSFTLLTPFPTSRLANAAINVLSVDQELSPLVHRQFSLTSSDAAIHDTPDEPGKAAKRTGETSTVLQTVYWAATSRMLRVSVNGFFESLKVVVQVMEELDQDVLQVRGLDDLVGVQGIEQGLTGAALKGA